MIRTCTQIVTLLLVPVALAATACQERGAAVSTPAPVANAAVRQLVDGKTLESSINGAQMSAAERAQLIGQVRRFYQAQNYQLVWSDRGKPSSRYAELQKVIASAADQGLPPELYKLPVLEPAGADKTVTDDQAARFDVTTSASFFRYFLHLTGGRLDPHALQSLWTLKPKRPDLVTVLVEAVSTNGLAAAMAHLQPAQPEYRELQKAVVRYRAIAAKGGWPSIPAKTRLKPGQSSEAIPALKQRLAMEGDLDPSFEKDPDVTFSEPLVQALKKFQERHRIKPTGVLTGETIAAINVPVAERIRAIELNLERWRWLPDPMPGRYLIVNVPDFRLEAIEQGRAVMDMRVVVGAPDNKTPIFADEMTEVIFSPYWNVPPGIAEEETIPRAASDPGFLSRNNMEVVTQTGETVDPYSVDWSNTKGLRIRQRPGSGNALGGVKFIFPNSFDVYLHDTNATTLFNRLERGLSHGCVRVEEPHKLAQYVLRDQPEWTPEAISAAMKSGQEKHVKLKAPIPVYIVYTTAWVHDGGVRFLKDLYGHDADQAAKLWDVSNGTQTRR
jgi:murein L,D-transpeptidase YcbB/YkuD